MGGHPVPGISCTLCSKPVDLRVDLSADENGKAAHEDCYVKRNTTAHSRPFVDTMTDWIQKSRLPELRRPNFSRNAPKAHLRLAEPCPRFVCMPRLTTVRLTMTDLHNQNSSGAVMTSQVVNLQVTASIPIACDFWSEDDCWKGLCKSLSITVRGSSFEDAKKNMATELQVHIERILRERPKRSVRRIA